MTDISNAPEPGRGNRTFRVPFLKAAGWAMLLVLLSAGAGWAFAAWHVHGAEILSTLAETGLQGCL